MASWANTYPGLDAALHEMASTLTSSPMAKDDDLEDVATAVRNYYRNEMSGSSFQFDGWSEPQQKSSTEDPTSGETTDTTAKSTSTTTRR